MNTLPLVTETMPSLDILDSAALKIDMDMKSYDTE
jgi:hypothetical protein